MPAAVLGPRRDVPEKVLLAELARDPGGGPSRSRADWTISVRPPLSSVIIRSARDVHAIVLAPPVRPRRAAEAAAAGARGSGWARRCRQATECAACAACGRRAGRRGVDADRIDHHFRLRGSACCTSANVDLAVGVVAVGDHDERLLSPRARARRAESPRRPSRRAPCRQMGLTDPSARTSARRSSVHPWTSSAGCRSDTGTSRRAGRAGRRRSGSAPPAPRRSSRRPCCRSCRARCPD